MLRAVLVGFLLGFAVVGGVRLSQGGGDGPQLTSAQALHRGAALDHVANRPCPPDGPALDGLKGGYGPMLVLI